MVGNLEESHSSNLRSETYTNTRGRQYEMYVLSEDLVNTLVLGYSDEHRLAVVQELRTKHEALIQIRDEADTIGEAKGIAANALVLQREGLRKQQSSFDDVIAKAYNEGTFKSPSVGLAIANANKIPSIVVLGNQPSTIEKNTGYRPRDLLVITEDAVGLSKYTEAVGQVKLLASMGFDAKAIRSMVCSLH